MLKLYPHQNKLLELNPKKHALIHEMGTGKTITSLELCIKNKQEPLIICPKGLKKGWEETIKRYYPTLKYVIYTKETFRRDYKKVSRYNCIIYDEIHYALGTKSAMMKTLRSYLSVHNPEFRYFLSGTVYRSSPFDVFMLCNLLDKKLDYWKFFHTYFYKIPMGNRMIPIVKKGIEEDIGKLARSVGSVLKLEECVDMPESIHSTENFKLNVKQIEAINLLEEVLPIVKYSKIHQICGGTLKGNEYEEDKIIGSPKADRLIELSVELNRMIVVCRYNNEIEYLKQLLENTGKYVKVINGSVDGSNRYDILKDLEQRDEYILLVNASVSEGWQLQNCCHMIFYSYSFELKNKLQMEGRLRRIDKPRPVFYLSLVCEKTIDEDVISALNKSESFHIEIYNEDKTKPNISE